MGKLKEVIKSLERETVGTKDKRGTRFGDSEKSEKKTDGERGETDQFVVLGGELGEPLVKLKHCYYGHQIPEEERKGHSRN